MSDLLLIKKLIEKTIHISSNVLDDANLLISDISEIILVGGSTRTPYVKHMVQDFFNKKPLSNINARISLALELSYKDDSEQ